MEKIFGVVILFNPQEDVRQNISGYLPFVDKLLVIDNSEPPAKINLGELEDKENVVLLAEGINKGIAIRLNEAAAYALSEGASWLLTMDQDSSFDEKEIINYFSCFANFEHKDQVAMFGTEYETKPASGNTCQVTETGSLITSGSLVNLSLFGTIGGFDENLFIDEVDYEYCLRANINGYKTLKFPHIYLNHSLGTVSSERSLKTFRPTQRTLHSPVRLYYMCRNYLYVRKKYAKHYTASLRQKKMSLLNFIKNNLLYNPNRLQVFRFIWLGFAHYIKGRMGKLA